MLCPAGPVFEPSHLPLHSHSSGALVLPGEFLLSPGVPLTDGAETSFHEFCVPGLTHPALFLPDRISVELCQGLSAPWQ